MLSARYGALDLRQWLEVKRIMFLQSFWPLHHAISRISLNSDYGADAIDRLRAWDFMMLSKGNVAVPFFVIVAAWMTACAFFRKHRDQVRADAPFVAMIGISLCAWLLIILGFFTPVIIHHWPQAALFGLALGGAVMVHGRHPLLFAATLLAVMTYTGVVWILSPLKSALDIDPGAAIVLAILASWTVVGRLLPTVGISVTQS
jgi:hypothetical protein